MGMMNRRRSIRLLLRLQLLVLLSSWKSNLVVVVTAARRTASWNNTSSSSSLRGTSQQQSSSSASSLYSNIVVDDGDVLCRVTVVETILDTRSLFNIEDTTNNHIFQNHTDDKHADKHADEAHFLSTSHEVSCIPIVDWKETDDLFPIELPDDILQDYESTIQAGQFVVTLTHAHIIPDTGIEITPDVTDYIVHLGIADGADDDNENSIRQLDFQPRMTVAFIRIATLDSQVYYDTETLRDDSFDEHLINFKTQYEACSFGQLKWELTNVYDIKLPTLIRQYTSGGEIVRDAQNKFKVDYPNIASMTDIADKIIFCAPHGIGGWAASAGVRHWRVQMNNDWCMSLTGVVHELGHTMGLLHSNGPNGEAYGDRTGYMGSGYTQRFWPRKCFNGFHSYQFGWYQQRHLDITDSFRQLPKLVKLATFVDYDDTQKDEPVIINIDNTYFLQYNRAKTINAHTEQKQNQLTITQTVPGGTHGLAGLNPGETYQLSNYANSGQNLYITACERQDFRGRGLADIMMVSLTITDESNEKLKDVCDPLGDRATTTDSNVAKYSYLQNIFMAHGKKVERGKSRGDANIINANEEGEEENDGSVQGTHVLKQMKNKKRGHHHDQRQRRQYSNSSHA